MESLIEELKMILEDDSMPKNIKFQIESTINTLQDNGIEVCIRTNKALQALSELSDDPNIPNYVRPQIWNIISQLETI